MESKTQKKNNIEDPRVDTQLTPAQDENQATYLHKYELAKRQVAGPMMLIDVKCCESSTG